MVIQTNIMALNAYRQLSINQNAMARAMERLASGYRINRAGDDPAGLAISEKMRAQIKGLEMAEKNALDGISLVQTAEGAMTEVHAMLNRMTELATQASNGIYDDDDREKLNAEFQQLKSEIDRISKATNFNGKNLLDGTLAKRSDGSGGLKLQIGDDAASYNILGVNVNDMSSKGLSLKDIDISTQKGAQSAVDAIKNSINTVSSQRASLGATQNRLEHTINSLGVSIENIMAAESRIRDTDMAKEMMEYTRASILTQSSQAMLAQANMIPQGMLSLLR